MKLKIGEIVYCVDFIHDSNVMPTLGPDFRHYTLCVIRGGGRLSTGVAILNPADRWNNSEDEGRGERIAFKRAVLALFLQISFDQAVAFARKLAKFAGINLKPLADRDRFYHAFRKAAFEYNNPGLQVETGAELPAVDDQTEAVETPVPADAA